MGTDKKKETVKTTVKAVISPKDKGICKLMREYVDGGQEAKRVPEKFTVPSNALPPTKRGDTGMGGP